MNMKLRALPIEMIGWFDFSGDLKPVSFRFDIGGELFKGRILSVQKKFKEKFAGNDMEVFTCNVEIDGRQTLAEFKYEEATHKWMLFKI